MTNPKLLPNKRSVGNTRAALGLRVHSGWAAMVAVGGTVDSPVVLDRRRIELAAQDIPGSTQPYHTAETLSLKDAERLVSKCRTATTHLARAAIGAAIEHLAESGHSVVACGVLLSSGRLPDTLAAILASHTLIHSAEGEFYRQALKDAAAHWGVPLVTVREKELLATGEAELGESEAQLLTRVTEMGKALGSPWRQDEKYATVIGCLAMGRAMKTRI